MNEQHKEIVPAPFVTFLRTILDLIDQVQHEDKKNRKKKKMSIDEFNELERLYVWAELAIGHLESSEFRKISDGNLLNFCHCLFGLGKRIDILSSIIGLDFSIPDEAECSNYQHRQKVLHAKGSGKGGEEKAKNERKEKLEAIEPLMKVIGEVRFTGKYRNHKEAVHNLLTTDERFSDLADRVYSTNPKQTKISEDFLMKEAKKNWDNCAKTTKQK